MYVPGRQLLAAIAFAIPAQLAAPVLHPHGIKLAHDAAGQIVDPHGSRRRLQQVGRCN